MQLTTLILAFVVAVTAAPAAPTLAEMQSLFASSEQCKLPKPKESCSGATRSDIIITYNKETSTAEKQMLVNAAKASGGDIVHEWKDFGFSGFVPDGVVALFRAHREVASITIYDNACLQVPECGDEPC